MTPCPHVKTILCLAMCFVLCSVRAQSTPAAGFGNLTQLCEEYPLSPLYEQYLNTSFLGEAQHVQLGSVNYQYWRFGPLQPVSTGRPLVLIIGSGATASDWTPDLLKNLAQQRPVVIFDNPGIGGSTDSDPQNYTLASYTESIVDFLGVVSPHVKPDILGWSLGGFVGLAIGVYYSDAVNRIVLADTAPGGYGLATDSEQNEVSSMLATGSAGESSVEIAYPDTPAGEAGLCRFLTYIQVMPKDPTTPEQLMRQAAVDFDYDGEAGQEVTMGMQNITNPVLIIAGQQDSLLPISYDIEILDAIPGASLVEFADAGHSAILQNALASAAEINAFLSLVD